ncbi:MAG TPA: Rid family detoxifying hydrolase [Ktedonobacterales bacterium]|jgi:2-iminobutanoate/2-iminopropanoate deaminase|nr:Rid family detoxifying hydrolase [Ktedonobacterales bacterium]
MPKEIIYTDQAPKPPASYSQAVKVGGFVFVAGQGPFDPMTGEVVGETIQEQTQQCLRNIEAILTAAGSSLEQIVSTTFILGDESDFSGMNEEWVKWFPTNPPARQGAQLPIHPKGMKLSVAVIAEA